MDGTLSALYDRKGRFTIWAALILLGVACLTLMGLVTLFSASHSIYNDNYSFLRKQLVWLVISLVAAFGSFIVPVERLRDVVWILSGFILFSMNVYVGFLYDILNSLGV